MRPLPILDDLSPAQDVYNPATDGFDVLLGSDLSNFDALQSLLESTADPAVGSLGDMQTTLDAMGSVFDGIDGTFGQLDSSLSQLSYEQEIQDALALDKSFASNLSGWTFNAGPALEGFLQDVASALNTVLKDIFAALSQIAGFVITSLEDLFGWIINLIWQAIAIANAAIELAISALSEIAFMGGTGSPPSGIGTGF